MRFTLATIATAALIFSASAAPHKGYGKGRNSTDTDAQAASGRGRYSDGTFPSGAFGGSATPTGSFPGFGSKPSGTAGSAAPTGAAGGGYPTTESPESSDSESPVSEDEASDDYSYSNATSSSTISTRASSTFPDAAGESTLSEPMEVTDFDGGLVRFGRGVSCSSGEGGESDAVFVVADGGSLSNVIIGADQIEGVYCVGSCTITNVWWEAVCEDALSFKGDGAGTVSGGGAKGANDKVIQHNGIGTISVSGFYVEDFGKLYRSCGNCETQGERHVILDSITASGGSSAFVGINSNFGDTATITNSCITDTEVICQEYEGTSPGNEPEKTSSGPSSACIYTDADISVC